MDWANILAGVIAALVVAIGLPLALRKRKKAGPENVEKLFQHLQKLGVRASPLEKGAQQEKVGISRASGQRSEGVIKIEGKDIDYINVSSASSQYGVNYFLNYLVTTSSWTGKKDRKKTSMVRKRSSGIWGRVVDIEWRGDAHLSRELNFDYRLKDILLQTEPKEVGGGIQIFPEPKHEYARVRTAYLLPSSGLLEAIDIIAKYVKSGW